MLRGTAGVEVERILKRADGVLAVLQELEDPNPRGVPERAKHRRFGDVQRRRLERHA